MRSSNGFGGLLVLTCCVGLAIVSGCGASSYAGDSTSDFEAGVIAPVNSGPSAPLFSQIDRYQNRYPLHDTHTKLVNYAGSGDENLYGVRNFRAVLNGVAYRGGANNPNNKYGRKANNNPLPLIGIENLCKEGFSTAIYLYPTNFSSVPHTYDCVNRVTGLPNHFEYKQYNPTTPSGQTAIVETTYRALVGGAGPVYVHCWNGWHASGVASAILLRQFCGLSADAAVAYWTLNTDGAPVDSTYTSLKERIRQYVVKPGYPISADLRVKVCPE